MRKLGCVVIFWALASCASTGEARRDDPGTRRLSEAELEHACGNARLAMNCQHAMSAEGHMFTSCECTGEVQVNRGTLHITGSDESEFPVDAKLPVVWDGERWQLEE
ncbi:MAG: hypothetical protein R3F39_11515 [Myxococcota bacterium]